MSSQLWLQRQSRGLAARSEGTPHHIITLTSDSFHRDEIVYYRHICMAGSTERQGAHNKAICICSARASLSAPPRSFCLTCITATELPAGAGGVGWGIWGAQERGRGVNQSQRMTSGAAANLGFEWPVTSHCTATLKAVSGRREKKQKKRKKSHQGEQEGAWERWGAELPRVQSKGSPSWRRDGRRIDWRWWTINEVIDSGVRVAGWGLEINWNKHINTSSILHPKHTRTLSRIYYEPCLA